MRQTFVDYLQSIDLTQDPSSKIQIALTQLHSSSGSIYFTPEKSIGAVRSKVIIRNLNKFGPFQQITGLFKTFESNKELIFLPATMPYSKSDNILTIGNFLKDKTQYCIVEENIFDGGYINRSYDLDLYGPTVFVDFLQTSAPSKTQAGNTINQKLVPIASKRKQAVVAHFEEARISQNSGEKATYQEIYDTMGAPTKQQLWDILREKDIGNFHETRTDRALEPLASIAKELGFRFKGGRPTGNRKI
ncbi:hypothetical protein [Rheinheimera tilapiae]|uniref:Uncharacterized protein n=1 Tax=Rheinheimera tilapiae TaxID=875043 RepID=A0ABV6B8J9_9GAMM